MTLFISQTKDLFNGGFCHRLPGMRKIKMAFFPDTFFYGPINPKIHYYAPREELIERSYIRLVGECPDEDGHYITVWAPRQCGKTWLMQEVVEKIKKTGQYEVGILTMDKTKKVKKEKDILNIFTGEHTFKKTNPGSLKMFLAGLIFVCMRRFFILTFTLISMNFSGTGWGVCCRNFLRETVKSISSSNTRVKPTVSN
jgi:hypothetical protein